MKHVLYQEALKKVDKIMIQVHGAGEKAYRKNQVISPPRAIYRTAKTCKSAGMSNHS